mmetsp:Transcript_39455/g.61532  ORF Transcript_39455/g.61532 Transcript_39455/m.61532 type:complete len:80 (-) Transcript_39455:1515-1754(-)
MLTSEDEGNAASSMWAMCHHPEGCSRLVPSQGRRLSGKSVYCPFHKPQRTLRLADQEDSAEAGVICDQFTPVSVPTIQL